MSATEQTAPIIAAQGLTKRYGSVVALEDLDLAVEPGVILLYERNRRTVEALERRGWRMLTEKEVLAGAPVVDRGKTAITFGGPELSRARGGPRCMTMPLERESL